MQGRHLVLISWDGQAPPAQHVDPDVQARFDLILFDYSGRAEPPTAWQASWPGPCTWLSVRTACKGEILAVLARDRPALGAPACDRWIGLIDDDIAIAVSQINRTLERAAELNSLCCAPALSPEEQACVPHMQSQSASSWRIVPWVELKLPFVRMDLFEAAAPFYPLSISGYGLDCFVYPYLAHVLDLSGAMHVFDDLIVRDCRPHRSGEWVFANGLTGLEEARRLHGLCLRHLVRERPDLIGDPALRRVLRLPPLPCCA